MNGPSQPRVPHGITVTGTGCAAAAVDTVTAELAVEIVRSDAGEAFGTASTAVTMLLGVLADHGVDSRSVRTQNLSLGPRYDFRDNSQILSGYQATQEISVTLDGLSGVDAMLSDIAARGLEGLQIRQVSLTAARPREAGVHAREAAMADAKDKAAALATLAGRSLGPVVAVVELPDSSPIGIALKAASHSTPMPVMGGDQDVRISLRVRFAWADG